MWLTFRFIILLNLFSHLAFLLVLLGSIMEIRLKPQIERIKGVNL